jgi:RNA polymerase sigma-70 factor (sigma-E family)
MARWDAIEDEQFTTFVRTSRGQLRRSAYLLCNDWHEADDLVQVALIAVLRHWRRLRTSRNALPFARRVLVNAFLMERRRVRHQREELVEQIPEGDAASGVQVEDRLLLFAALSRLGPRQRAVIVLRLWEDLSVAQTARILECSPATVISQASRALTALRDTFGDFGHSDG